MAVLEVNGRGGSSIEEWLSQPTIMSDRAEEFTLGQADGGTVEFSGNTDQPVPMPRAAELRLSDQVRQLILRAHPGELLGCPTPEPSPTTDDAGLAPQVWTDGKAVAAITILFRLDGLPTEQ